MEVLSFLICVFFHFYFVYLFFCDGEGFFFLDLGMCDWDCRRMSAFYGSTF